jgi:hypothetical protein
LRAHLAWQRPQWGVAAVGVLGIALRLTLGPGATRTIGGFVRAVGGAIGFWFGVLSFGNGWILKQRKLVSLGLSAIAISTIVLWLNLQLNRCGGPGERAGSFVCRWLDQRS